MIRNQSPAGCGARNGLVVGAIITLLYFASVFSRRVPFLGLLTMVLAMAVPVAIYILLRNDYIASGRRSSIGALWLDGLISVMGGAALAGALLLIYLKWINPEFLNTEWEASVALFEASSDPAMKQLAADCREAARAGFSITPATLTMSLLWMAAFSGSLLSLIAATVIKTVDRNSSRGSGNPPAFPS